MKRTLSIVYLLSTGGCIQQLSTNIEQSNELMEENIRLMTESKIAIEANTREIERSTNTMQQFGILFLKGF